MKKILTVSLAAMMAVGAARADITSKSYVDGKFATKTDVGTVADLTTTAKTVVPAINELVNRVGTTNVTQQIENAVEGKADKATGLTGATKTKITYNDQGIVTAGADLEAADIPSLTLSKITDAGTLAGKNAVAESDLESALATKINNKADSSFVGALPLSATATTVVGYIDEAVTSAGGQTEQQVQDKIDTKVSALDGNVTGTGNAVVTISQTDGVVTATKDNVLDKVATATGEGNVVTAVTKNADGQTIDVEKGIKALTAADVDQTFSATSEKAQSGKAVAQAVADAGGQTSQQVSDAIDAKIDALQLGTMSKEAATDYTKTVDLDSSTTATSGQVVTAISMIDGQLNQTTSDPLDVTNYAEVADDTEGDGEYVLTMKKNGTSKVYKWEHIERASN